MKPPSPKREGSEKRSYPASRGTRRIAFHHLILPDGTRHDMAVAEFDAQGTLLSWHPLPTSGENGQGAGGSISYAEPPFVEWWGGTLDLTSQK